MSMTTEEMRAAVEVADRAQAVEDFASEERARAYLDAHEEDALVGASSNGVRVWRTK